MTSPASGPPTPHSTRRRDVRFVRAVDEMLNLLTAPLMPLIETNPLRRGGPLCPPAPNALVLPCVFVGSLMLILRLPGACIYTPASHFSAESRRNVYVNE